MANRTKSSSKQHQKLSKNHIDLISKLPQSLLCHILSFLPTKEAVATTILAKTWHSHWTFVPNLDLQENDTQKEYCTSFGDVVNKVLFQPNLSRIKKLRLKCSSNSKSLPNLDSWFCSAVSRNVEELDLSIQQHSSTVEQVLELPCIIFSCKTLVSLKLTGQNILINVSFSLPRLKILNLVRARYEDEESFRNIFYGCPVLEDLVVEVCDIDEIDFVHEIVSATLKTLRVEIKYDTYVSRFMHEYTLKINAPSLEYLTIDDDVSKDYYLENLGNLVEANVDVKLESHRFENALRVIQALQNAKFLKLSQDIMRVICCLDSLMDYAQFYSIKDYPEFQNLVELKLEDCCCLLAMIKNMIQKSPYLKHMHLEKTSCYNSCRHRREGCWVQPMRVPNCLSLHLTTFYYRGFEGLEDELEFIRYILKNSKVLRDMMIEHSDRYVEGSSWSPTLDWKEQFEVLQKLIMFERGSSICQLKFGKYL